MYTVTFYPKPNNYFPDEFEISTDGYAIVVNGVVEIRADETQAIVVNGVVEIRADETQYFNLSDFYNVTIEFKGE